MKIIRKIVAAVFYLLVLGLLISRTVAQVISHDENQFIAAGQMLADHGWVPYRDYPYAHMPYAVALYGLTAKLSAYDYLSARLLGVVSWMGCIGLLIAISRFIGRHFAGFSSKEPTWTMLYGEFIIVFVFLYDPGSSYVLSAALNHSFATFFSLFAFLVFMIGTTDPSRLDAAVFCSGISISIASLIRFNFASLAVILLVLWLFFIFTSARSRLLRTLLVYILGVVTAGLPALALLASSPPGFYFANILYIRLNTLYYQSILFRHDMNLPAKVTTFLTGLIHSPIDVVLYVVALASGVTFLAWYIRTRSVRPLVYVGVAAFAGTLFLTAFSPTPTQAHYFFAPLPYILLIVAVLGWMLHSWNRLAYVAAFSGLLTLQLITSGFPNPAGELAVLSSPAQWTPIQVHDFAVELRHYVPSGRILTLMPMIPAEAGYEIYPFTTSGPFVWRTSILLSHQRRAVYGVVSPAELSALLDSMPPAGILTGFETGNAGFTVGDLGGLETPFTEYALQHHYRALPLRPGFMGGTLYLWVQSP